MSNIQHSVDDYINTANNNIAAAAGNFMNYIEDMKLIVDEDQKSIINEQLAKIDAAYEKILDIYRPNIRNFVNSHIRVISATDRIISQGNK